MYFSLNIKDYNFNLNIKDSSKVDGCVGKWMFRIKLCEI